MGYTEENNDFKTNYTNVAVNVNDIKRIDATFKRFNDPDKVTLVGSSLKITRKAETLDSLNLGLFFHPLQAFSSVQKHTLIIEPLATVYLESSGYVITSGEISMLVAKAEYLPEAKEADKILYWNYKDSPKAPMGKILVLTGAIKKGIAWKGWDIEGYSTLDHSDTQQIVSGGFSFTNVTDKKIKVTVVTSN